MSSLFDPILDRHFVDQMIFRNPNFAGAGSQFVQLAPLSLVTNYSAGDLLVLPSIFEEKLKTQFSRRMRTHSNCFITSWPPHYLMIGFNFK